ncbi:hypothetical protein [Methylacidiphilum caldifontis]|uniref:Uncharacterized protein n=1 Tax=Methylacidiphilum caldifontis TaxID=2795386 RepID=A0A4Y8PD86_9BACT|nr:hypothetical protein [Methylacidiphilum caldifontis]TFE67937.1 hypothetical protein A7Q10_08920 [Methylacidiphilum caldifontis]
MDDFEEIWEQIKKASPYPKPDPHFMDRFKARLHYEKIQCKKRKKALRLLAGFCFVFLLSTSLLSIGQRCMQSWMRDQIFNSLEVIIENVMDEGTALVSLDKPVSAVSEVTEEIWSEETLSF